MSKEKAEALVGIAEALVSQDTHVGDPFGPYGNVADGLFAIAEAVRELAEAVKEKAQ